MIRDARGNSIQPGDTLQSIAIPTRMVRLIGASDELVVIRPDGWQHATYSPDGMVYVKRRTWDKATCWAMP